MTRLLTVMTAIVIAVNLTGCALVHKTNVPDAQRKSDSATPKLNPDDKTETETEIK